MSRSPLHERFRQRAKAQKQRVCGALLREQLRAQPKYAAEIRTLQDQVLLLSAELQAARSQRAERS
jgi:hypothetical protein